MNDRTEPPAGRAGPQDPRARVLRERHALVGPPALWRMKRDFQLAFLKARGLKPHHRLLDVGCGTMRGGLPLIGYLDAGRYVGVDVRIEALAQGFSEIREAGLEDRSPTVILLPDIGELSLARPVDFAWAFSVLFHMTDEIVDRCFAAVSRNLGSDGQFYANVVTGARATRRWREFPVVWRRLDDYESLASRHDMRMETLGELRDLGHVSGQKLGDAQIMLRCVKTRGS